MTQPPTQFPPVPSAPRTEGVIVALGTALLATAVTTAALWSRWDDGDLDVLVFLLGVVATLGLLGTAGAAWRLVADPEQRSNLIAWPGAAGVVGVGAMIAVGIDDMNGLGYLVGAVIVGGSVVGHLVVPRPPFVLSGILGLAVLYLQLVSDLFEAGIDLDQVDDNVGMIMAIALVIFTVVITMLARRFLPSADFAGLVVGTGAVVLSVVMSVGLGVYAAISTAFAGMGEWDEETGEYVESATADNVYENDLWVLLICGALLVAFWLWLAWSGGPDGYRVIALAQAALLVPVVTVALGADQPAIWVGVSLVGGLAVGGLALSRALGLGGPMAPPPAAPHDTP